MKRRLPKRLRPTLRSDVAAALAKRRAATLSPERRREIARKASAARWGLVGVIGTERTALAIDRVTGSARTVLSLGDVVAAVDQMSLAKKAEIVRHLLSAMPRAGFDALLKGVRGG